MIELQILARQEQAEGAPFHEKVAVCFVHGEDEHWYALPNSAEVNPDGRGEFLVEGHDLGAVFLAHREEMHPEFAELSRAPRCDLIILWHTHLNTVEPSDEDIADFRSDIFDVGMVWHVPTGQASLYNAHGTVIGLEPAGHSLDSSVQVQSSLATGV